MDVRQECKVNNRKGEKRRETYGKVCKKRGQIDSTVSEKTDIERT